MLCQTLQLPRTQPRNSRNKKFVQNYVGHLEEVLKNRQQQLLEVAREKRRLESRIKQYEGQPRPERFGNLFDGREKLPVKLRVHVHMAVMG